eukprot:7352158-Prymnesium_polylepis.2
MLSHRKVLKICVATDGTRMNVTRSTTGRMRCSPETTAFRAHPEACVRERSSCKRYFAEQAGASSHPTHPAAPSIRRAIGQHAPIRSRRRYEPMQAGGMRTSKLKSNSRTQIQPMNGSSPAGVTTLKTLGTAAMH